MFKVWTPCFYTLKAEVCVCVHACSVASDVLRPHGLYPPGSSVHGISQARILEWVAISSSRDLPDQGIEPCLLCLLHWQGCSLPLSHQGSPERQRCCIMHRNTAGRTCDFHWETVMVGFSMIFLYIYIF